MQTKIRNNYILAVSGWSIAILLSIIWNYRTIHQQTKSLAFIEARSLFNKDKAFRFWAASHGGVYVPKSTVTPPNPYLKDIPYRDIVLPDGKEYTLMNPAYMLRQMMEQYENLYGIRGHITSDKHFRKETAPDPWERSALKRFAIGEEEVIEESNLNGEPYLRLMQPLYAKKSCLKCHRKQGYKEGDLRGGVSLSVPLKSFYTTRDQTLRDVYMSHGIIFLIGFFAIHLMTRSFKNMASNREMTEEYLRRYKHIIDNTSDRMSLLDRDYKYLAVNKSYTIFHNKPVNQIIGSSVADILGDEIFNSVIKNKLDQCLGGNIVHYESWFQFPGQKNLYLDVTYFPYKDNAGNVTGIVVNTRDITEHKVTQMQLEEYHKYLEDRINEEINKRREHEQLLIQKSKLASMGEMIGNIAHQWKQPLNALSLIVMDLEEAYDYGELNKEYIARLTGDSNRVIMEMSDTIDHFRNFFKPSEHHEEFNLNQVIEEVRLIVGGSLKNNNIELIINIEEGINIHGAKNDFAQVLLNLVGNAKDSLKISNTTNPKITINGRLTDNQTIYISIEDNGDGIPVNIIDKIFEPYYTTKEETGGSGIGLYMSRLIIEKKFNGTINARNSEKGAIFEIHLKFI